MPAAKTPPRRIVSEPLSGPGVTENTISYQGGEQLVRDPGPPPARPAMLLALYGHPTAEMLFVAASPQGDHERANAADPGVLAIRRERVQTIDLMRQPPQVHQYKAELLSWLDALASFHSGG